MTSQSDKPTVVADTYTALRGEYPTQVPSVLALLRLIRPHQWTKNAFVAAPLFLSPATMSMPALWLTLAGVLAFSLVASSVYILNDYLDRDTDRLHPKKCRRPIASGDVSTSAALALFVVMLAAGLTTAFSLDAGFGRLVAAYFVVNVAYCLAGC